jgi:hypothetical protein
VGLALLNLIDVKTLSDIETLKEGESPKVYSSNNMNADGKALVSKGYIALVIRHLMANMKTKVL